MGVRISPLYLRATHVMNQRNVRGKLPIFGIFRLACSIVINERNTAIAIAPTRVGNKVKFHVGWVKNTITELEPAGGCTVLVTIITAIAKLIASAKLY